MTETHAFENVAMELPAKRFDVVIAGGGVAGLTLAKALADGLGPAARIGLVTREAAGAANPMPDGRATALSAASVRMLARLGVWAACEGAAQAVTAIDITDSELEAGIRPVLLSYDNVVTLGEPASHIVPNAALLEALAAVVAATPAVTRFPGAVVSAFRAGPERIDVRLDTGERFDAALLAAADGRGSPLRGMAGITTVGWAYPQTGITVTVAHERPHGGRAVQHFLPGGPFAMLPLPGERTCITWSERADAARHLLALDDLAFLDHLERRAGGRLGALTVLGRPQSWPLEMFVARSFIGPRFALVGDGAHNVHPIAGQGLNLGLRDVAALAEVLVDGHRLGLDIAGPAALTRYEKWRRFDTMSSAASFDALNRLFSTQGALRRSVREFGLGVVNRLPGLKQRLVAEAAGLSGELPRLLKGEAI